MRELLLLSGGMDSAALAAWRRPAGTLTIDYGQLPAYGELVAARAVADALELEHAELRIDCSSLGSGLLAGRPELASVSTVPEWWPFRNQLLATLAAPWALQNGFEVLLFASVRTDGNHCDGTPEFYRLLNDLLHFQEGLIRAEAPAINMSTVELIQISGIPRSVLGWTISCHRGAYSCGHCGGCHKHVATLEVLDAGLSG